MVPLLIENHLTAQADRIAVVDLPVDLQLTRTQARDGISPEQAQRILAAQTTREQRLACADDIIDNSGSADALAPQVAVLHRRYLALAQAAAASTGSQA